MLGGRSSQGGRIMVVANCLPFDASRWGSGAVSVKSKMTPSLQVVALSSGCSGSCSDILQPEIG